MARTGKRIGRLLGASGGKTQPPPYQAGLQTMWTDHRLHTQPAPRHIILRGVRGLTPGGGTRELHRTW